MRILVTGGAGYIGSHTVRHLLQHGHDVVVYDNLSAGHRAAVPSGRLIVADLADQSRLDLVMIQSRIEAIIHFAASAAVGESTTNPAKYYQNNLMNSMGLLETCRRHHIERFVFSSTCATYGVPDQVPISEECLQQPINPYGNTKLAFELALGDYARAYPIGFAALRYFNAAGASADGDIGEDHTPEMHLIPIAIQAALGLRSQIDVFGTDYPTPDGTCIRDYIHVDDLASAHRLALERLVPHSALKYNVGTGRGYSVREVIDTVERVTGRQVPVREAARRSGDPPQLVASPEKIRRELGWEPVYRDLTPIVESAWRWHQAHPRGHSF